MEKAAVRILILEDVPSDAKLIEHVLRKGGIDFVRQVVEDRKSFLESLDRFSPDIVLSDYSLPGFDGETALKIAIEKTPEMPFIFVSGAVGEEFAVGLLKSGATDFVLKDRISRLPLCVKRALEGAEEKRILRKAEDDLQKAHQRLITVQEEERRCVARELHDSLGGCLMAMKFALETELDAAEKDQDPARVSRLQALIGIVEESFNATKRMQKQLSPPVLDDFGLQMAVQSLCRDFQAWYPSIRVKPLLEIREEDVPENLKITIYRVVQEALNNVAKHSEAKSASITLSRPDDRIHLVVQDKGRGFDFRQYEESRTTFASMGITGMRERTRLSGGTFSIRTTPGKGTIIRASWPCSIHPPVKSRSCPEE